MIDEESLMDLTQLAANPTKTEKNWVKNEFFSL